MQNIPLIKQKLALEPPIFSKSLTVDHHILTCIIINAPLIGVLHTFGPQHKYDETNISFRLFIKITIYITHKKHT